MGTKLSEIKSSDGEGLMIKRKDSLPFKVRLPDEMDYFNGGFNTAKMGRKRKGEKVLTMRENLGGEYGRN